MKKLDPNTMHWQKLANRLARDYCPAIYACQVCGHPVVTGCCCTRCGSVDPKSGEQ